MPTLRAGDRLVWDVADVDPGDLARFGGKGAGLARMDRAGIPVPPAFVIGTDAFRLFHAGGELLPDALGLQLDDALARLESRSGKSFGAVGDAEPLLVSVRSGSAVSMPGMMDTVLNLGLDAGAAFTFGELVGDASFATDVWLRFWRMFGDIVLGIDTAGLEGDIRDARDIVRRAPSTGNFATLERAVVAWFDGRGVVAETRPRAQLDRAIAAVFGSWNSRRAKAYRKNQAIPDDLGTAVTIQAMVFGNRDQRSGSGVAFSCNPNTGERGLFGEYVVGRQGEDLVAGTATPVELSRPGGLDDALRDALVDHARCLERLYRDAVDIEFTVEAGRLFLLQVRSAKRTAEASVRVAMELLRDGTIDAAETVRRITPGQIGKLLRPAFDPIAVEGATVLATGIASSPGHAAGFAILDADAAAERAESGDRVILMRPTTSPQDIRGMLVADGIVTARGGALSHAAVVSRALDKPCIVGCESIDVDVASRTFAVGGSRFAEGTEISIDGERGTIYLGSIPFAEPSGRAELSELEAVATTLSGARVSIAALDFADLERTALADEPAIVGVTDLFISAGTIERLTSAIARLGEARSRDAASADIEALAHDVASRAFAAAPHPHVVFRLPSFLSERARQIVPAWLALPPDSLLPLGDAGFHVPIVRGIARAARASNGARPSVLLSGVTEPAEMNVFRADLAGIDVEIGAVVRSYAGLYEFASTSDRETDVWVDIDSVVRTAYGFPSELFSARGAFAGYLKRGALQSDPQATLGSFVRASVAKLVAAAGVERVGVILGAASPLDAGSASYESGCRRFAVLAGGRERLRLQLARDAVGGIER